MSNRTREMRKLMRELRKQGYDTRMTRGGHWRVSGGDLPTPLIAPHSPRSQRSETALLVRLKRPR